MPNARPASASIVLYPSSTPVANGDATYAPCGATSATRADGAASAAATSTPRNTRNPGVSTLPTHVRIFPGLSESASTTAKNASEKSRSHGPCVPLGSDCAMPTVYATVAQRGMANSGPIVRYSTHVNARPKRRPTRELRSRRPFERLAPSAATPSMGSPTPATRNPSSAHQAFLPASWPMWMGNIRLPAPKKSPNSMLETAIPSRTPSLLPSAMKPPQSRGSPLRPLPSRHLSLQPALHADMLQGHMIRLLARGKAATFTQMPGSTPSAGQPSPTPRATARSRRRRA